MVDKISYCISSLKGGGEQRSKIKREEKLKSGKSSSICEREIRSLLVEKRNPCSMSWRTGGRETQTSQMKEVE